MKLRIIAIAALSALSLTACASNTNTALVVNGEAISTKVISEQVDEIRTEIQQLPVGSLEKTPSLVLLTRMVVDRAISTKLLDLALERKGLTVTDEEVQAFADGVYAKYGKEQIQLQLMGTNGVAKSKLNEFMRIVYIQNLLGKTLGPNESQVGQTQELIKYVGDLSKEVGVQVSPRFGTWDPTQLQVVLGDETLSAIEAKAQGNN